MLCDFLAFATTTTRPNDGGPFLCSPGLCLISSPLPTHGPSTHLLSLRSTYISLVDPAIDHSSPSILPMISLLPSPPTPPSSPGSDPAWLMRPPIRTPPRKSRSAQEKLSRYKSLGVQNSKGLMKKKSMVNLRINTSTRIIANNEPTTPPSFRTPFPSPLKARTFPFSETLNRLLNEGVEDALSRRWVCPAFFSLISYRYLTGPLDIGSSFATQAERAQRWRRRPPEEEDAPRCQQ